MLRNLHTNFDSLRFAAPCSREPERRQNQ